MRDGVAQLTDDFVTAAQATLVEFDSALADARAGTRSDGGDARHAALQQVFRHAHDLRGLGGTFDYPLITHIGSSLCDLITQLEQVTDLHLDVIELHVSALKLVIAERITGDGGRQGQELTANIEVMVGKVLDQC